MGRQKPDHALAGRRVARLKRTEVVAGAMWSPFRRRTGNHPEPRTTPLFAEFLENHQKLYSSGCGTGSTSLGLPTSSLPTERCLDYASWKRFWA